jgi:hypothetical protein
MTYHITGFIKNTFSGSWNRHLLTGLVVLFGLYSFFIARTVVAVNQRKDVRAEIRDTQTRVSDLEIKYFNLASNIDMQKATELGFIDSQTPTFAYTKPAAETVAVR